MRMQSITNGFIIAFATYSKIPMPKVERNRKNMKYALCFFPAVGLVIGALLTLWSCLRDAYGLERICFALAGTVIPVAVTGGVHLEGFFRTAHKLSQKARRDFDAGVYGVIAVCCYFMLYGAGLSLIWKREQILLLGLSFVISRTLSGMSFVWFPAAEAEDPFYSFYAMARKRTVRAVLVTLLSVEFISTVVIQPVLGAVMALAAMWVWTYYYYMSKKQFGGISGDVSDHFLCLCELACVLVTGLVGRVM